MHQEKLPDSLQRATSFTGRIAVADRKGAWNYDFLLEAARAAATGLLSGRSDLEEARVVFLIPPGFNYVAVLWGVWASGGIAVPIGLDYPLPEIEYILKDTEPVAVVSTKVHRRTLLEVAEGRHVPLLIADQLFRESGGPLPEITSDRRAMILYTSGTTGRPKGVVSTHENIAAQISSLVEAWEWRSDDRILNPLPLHHVHGIINVLSCSLWVGGRCEMWPSFDSKRVFRRLSSGDFSLFMAVPTIYVKLIAEWKDASEPRRREFTNACARMRLMVSGSAALPVGVLEEWESITGQTLLERYGMTEIGMALSNPLHGLRRPGFVGHALPGVEVKLVDEHGETVGEEGVPGEICVRGGTVFKEYWCRESETREAFSEGWFRTGDIGVVEDGAYRILGRKSVDIIKTGGYKVSALEIEEVLRDHPKIKECSVVGLADEEWGERVSLAVVPSAAGAGIELSELRGWAAKRLARHKIPTRLILVDELPRNPMGKVQKPAVKRLFGRH